jgi:putative FmdB family regulatory protein
MPIYEYRCLDCGSLSEFLVGVGAGDRPLLCRQCGSHRLEKALSVVNSIRAKESAPGHTCCGKEERCSTPPCTTGARCRRD